MGIGAGPYYNGSIDTFRGSETMWRFCYLSFKARLGHYMLPVTAVFFASAIMLFTLVFDQVALHYEAYGYRQIYAGEIIIYSEPYILPSEGVTGEFIHALRQLPLLGDDLEEIYPLLVHQGYFRQEGVAPLDVTAIEALPSVRVVRPLLTLPIKVNGDYILLRARSIDADLKYGWADCRVSDPSTLFHYPPSLGTGWRYIGRQFGGGVSFYGGRYFKPDEDGELVCLVPYELSLGLRGDKVHIEVPRVVMVGEATHFDFSQSSGYELEIVGVPLTTIGSDVFIYNDDPHHMTGDIANKASVSKFYHWNGIMVPTQTWHEIFAAAGGQNASFIDQYVVELYDPSALPTAIRELRFKFPDLPLMPVNQLPAYHMLSMQQGVHPLTMGKPIAILLFTIACLICTSNFYLAVLKRRKELAICRVIGATRANILGALFLEMLLLSLFGACLGVLVAATALSLTMLTNHMTLTQVLSVSWPAIGTVLLAAVAMALLGGLAPMFKGTRISCMEVFRDVE